jgi:hypothetical protein
MTTCLCVINDFVYIEHTIFLSDKFVSFLLGVRTQVKVGN